MRFHVPRLAEVHVKELPMREVGSNRIRGVHTVRISKSRQQVVRLRSLPIFMDGHVRQPFFIADTLMRDSSSSLDTSSNRNSPPAVACSWLRVRKPRARQIARWQMLPSHAKRLRAWRGTKARTDD